MPKKEIVQGVPLWNTLVNIPRSKGKIFFLADSQEVWFPSGERKKLADLTSDDLSRCPLYINNLYKTQTGKS